MQKSEISTCEFLTKRVGKSPTRRVIFTGSDMKTRIQFSVEHLVSTGRVK